MGPSTLSLVLIFFTNAVASRTVLHLPTPELPERVEHRDFRVNIKARLVAANDMAISASCSAVG
jgi:hypothetical protein